MKVIELQDIMGRVFYCEPKDEHKADFTVARRVELEMTRDEYLAIPATSDAEEAFSSEG